MFTGKIEPLTTYRTRCGRGRTTYDPTVSPSQPRSVVCDGTVCSYAPTLQEAAARLKQKGCKELRLAPDHPQPQEK